jgi:hypothetical protein
MLTVKCALEEEIKQMTKDSSVEYRQQRTNWSIVKIEYFIQCIGFKQKFDIPPGALNLDSILIQHSQIRAQFHFPVIIK